VSRLRERYRVNRSAAAAPGAALRGASVSNFDNRNRGTLGANKRRRDGKDNPSHAGQVNVESTEYWVNAWVQENRETGEKFFSLSLRRKDAAKASQPAAKAAKPEHADFDDSIPF
jgi:hypothetical protein